MSANLTGTVAGVHKTATGIEVTVEFPSTDGGDAVSTLSIPVPIEKAKSLGIGTEVEVFLKKKRKPRVKAAEVANGPTATTAATGAPRGRRRVPAPTTPAV
jgi:hypothetical protein